MNQEKNMLSISKNFMNKSFEIELARKEPSNFVNEPFELKLTR